MFDMQLKPLQMYSLRSQKRNTLSESGLTGRRDGYCVCLCCRWRPLLVRLCSYRIPPPAADGLIELS